MANARYSHTVQLPSEFEEAWRLYQRQHEPPDTFNAFVLRLIQQELEVLCDSTTKI